MVKLHFIGNIAFRVYGNDHRPAHFHVVAPDFKAMVEIDTLSLIRGTIPARDRRAVMDWAEQHRAEIIAAWNLLNPDLAI
ncbi:DUF4160 domain-containing protein [Lichenibacterium ramalinae]|uniref:DUF4160 domain-containing protein n=1 Tax=Lichenibacterium ramalinae TaxID=2316527 RepID=A0A4Q2R7J2_9HYPH|nr:DUF4160 domain-containing protein [Lichenibacterium ramalinae]RYB01921.1 DUF4160 domain-containing protein [Lichenibacterium ramalinae]